MENGLFVNHDDIVTESNGLWMEGLFWLTLGVVFVFVIPKFVGKKKTIFKLFHHSN